MREKMEQLIKDLNEATKAYDEGKPYLTDTEWDKMYFQLDALEKETGEVLPNSPTHSISFQTVSALKKVEHNHLMLSLNKTKNLNEVESFVQKKEWIAMAKMDGLTCSLRYLNGRLVSAETRGNGKVGEDITHNALVIPSIPKIINFKEELIVDGEIICTYKNFKNFQSEYRHPRNFAAGSIRLLNSKECWNRKLTFIAWDVIKGGKYNYLSNNLADLVTLDFNIVPNFIGKDTRLVEVNKYMKDLCKELGYPIDGIVFKYDNIKEYNAAGHTDHHFRGGIAYKFFDESFFTRLQYINWTMGRTGVLTPVAVFDPIEIDGTQVSRANLHNYSVMKETLGDCAYVGEPLEIAKVNQIIPQVISAGPKYDYGYIISHGGVSANDTPEKCPICGHDLLYKTENGITRVYCDNPSCDGKLINRLEHFCGKKGLDIKGLSKKTLEKLIDWDWIKTSKDIFQLKEHQKDWINKTGFGEASVNKILDAIEEARKCTTSRFICAIGIPLIGKVASDALAQKFNTYNNFRNAIKNKSDDLYEIPGIGEVMIDTLLKYDYTEADALFNFINEISNDLSLNNNDTVLKDKNFCITGKLKSFKNRNELKDFIKSHGGTVTDTINSKTSYLINNDPNSASAKNIAAKKIGVPIIDEQVLLSLC